MLQSPKFHVSRTRLIIYNLPKTMTINDVKKLCREAVISRATKQNPVIRKVSWSPFYLISSMPFVLCVS
jgi:nucleolar protein 4